MGQKSGVNMMTIEERLDNLEEGLKYSTQCLETINDNIRQIIEVMSEEERLDKLQKLRKVLGVN